MAERQYVVLMGNFGSGKTELALHFARSAAADRRPATLVDLDIVNPYFRASERAAALAEQGIDLISPRFAMSNVEIITIDPRIYSVFTDKDGIVIFDVGGDNVGARALGQYQAYFTRIPAQNIRVWLVINTFRPLSGSADRLIAMLEQIENASRLKVGGLINNSNLSTVTTGAELRESYDIVAETARRCGLPVVYTSGEAAALSQFMDMAAVEGLDQAYIGQPLTIATEMHRDWDRFAKYGV